eukprot:SAG11_NODE_14314_length_617_cov_1.021236_1_plen_158_part_00
MRKMPARPLSSSTTTTRTDRHLECQTMVLTKRRLQSRSRSSVSPKPMALSLLRPSRQARPPSRFKVRVLSRRLRCATSIHLHLLQQSTRRELYFFCACDYLVSTLVISTHGFCNLLGFCWFYGLTMVLWFNHGFFPLTPWFCLPSRQGSNGRDAIQA